MLRRLETLIAAHQADHAYWSGMDASGVALRIAKERHATNEGHCKWRALMSLLNEDANAVIFCADETTANQLRHLLAEGLDAFIARQRRKYEAWQQRFGRKTVLQNRRKRKTPEEPVEPVLMEDDDGEDDKELSFTAIKIISEEADPMYSWIEKWRPSRVIAYNPSLGLIRAIECHAARHKEPMQLVTMTVRDSVEEEGYLLAVRGEKDAFERLIKVKANLVIPPSLESRRRKKQVEWDPDMAEVMSKFETGAADAEDVNDGKIIVDARELRSELPFCIYRHGLNLIPQTLIVGDYLLTPECAVERKSLSDLIQSLNSGRLHNQAAALCAAYPQACLLIEFSEDKFSLLERGELRGDIDTHSVLSKLCLLILHHPRLRLLWSPSLMATVNLFSDLKRGKPDPLEEELALTDTRENQTAKELLLSLPGINSTNVHSIMRHCRNLRELMSLDQATLMDRFTMSLGDAKRLHDFLHKPF